MSKIKMRCITCGKWFQSANAKEVTCPECAQKARKEKLAAKNAPSVSTGPGGANSPSQQSRPVVPPPPKPKSVQSGTTHWLDTLEDVKVGQPEPPSVLPKSGPPAPRDNRSGPGGYRAPTGPGNYRDDRGPGAPAAPGGAPGTYRDDRDRGPGGYREGGSRGPGGYREDNRAGGGYRVGGGSGLPGTTPGPRPRQPQEGGPARSPYYDRPRPGGPPREGGPGGQKPRGKGRGPSKPPTPPKPKREKIPPPEPFTPTAEQIKQVEERYIELSTPSEFDGIRTRIATELGIPKKAVKKIVKELRDRQSIPSWWELQTYKGSSEELERIKAVYVPLLPVPLIGVHKQLAEQLDLKAGIVYQAIKAIRIEMNLPQYNDPALHGLDASPTTKQNGQKAQDVPTSQETAPATDGESQEVASVVSVPSEEAPANAASEEAPANAASEEAPVNAASEDTQVTVNAGSVSEESTPSEA